MQTLITGGSGFIGSNLDGDIKLSSSDVDFRKFSDTLDCFKKYRPTKIINCAAKFGNYINMQREISEYFSDNMRINLNVYEAARLTGVQNMISTSTITAFPSQVKDITKFTEDELYDGKPDNSCYTSAYAKRMVDVLSRSYKEQYGLNYICTFITNTYGPNFKLDNGVVPFLIHKCYLAKKYNKDLIIEGDGTPLRDFIFVKDVNKILNWLLNNYNESKPVIISTGVGVQIKELVDIIVQKFNFKGRVLWNHSNNLGQKIKLCDNSYLLSLKSDIEFTSLEEGISETIDWFLNNKEKYEI